MASHGILPYEKEELQRILEEEYSNIRNIITKNFYQQESIVGRWINFLQPSNNDNGESNATIAHPKRSDKSSFDRINDAGEALMKKGKINIDENSFEGDISTASNVGTYMTSMFAKLRKLDKCELTLSENDIKLIVSNIMEQTITNIGNINEPIQKEWKSPIIDTQNYFIFFLLADELLEEVEEAEEHLQKNVEDFLDYYKKTWTGYTYRRREKKPRYAIEIWNVHEATMNNKPRTNNTTERWHKQLKENVRVQYPPFYTIVKELQKQHANSNVIRNQLITGVVFKRKKEYAEKDERVLNVVKTFKIDTVLDFLKNVNIAASAE